MAPPTYFFPSISRHQLVSDDKLVQAILAPRKLDRTFADVQSVQGDHCYVEETVTAGPGGSPGTLFMVRPVTEEVPARTGYYPDHQDWTHFAEGDLDFWVCIDKSQPPTPGDLARREKFDGYWIELAGDKWLVPVVRDLRGGSGLPKDWLMGPDGQVTEEIQAAYQELWTEFAGVVDVFLNPNDVDGQAVFAVDRADGLKWCVQALSINYRIGRAEQNLLRLVNSENWTRVLGATVDLKTFWDVYEAAKKKAPSDEGPKDESPDTAPGAPADSLTTDPAEAS